MRRSNAKGLSVLEVLIALGVLTAGILAVVGVFPLVFKNTSNAWTTSKIMFIAQKTMDDELSKGFSDTMGNPHMEMLDVNGTNVGYIKTWREADPNGNANIQIVKVEVVWTVNGRTKRYLLTSAVAP